jgi:hypothetical protein
MKRLVLSALVAFAYWAGPTSPARADLVYTATGVYGGGAGVIMPWFWGYDAISTFTLNDVKFTTTATGATLTGLVQSINGNGNGWFYNLNVSFTKVTDPSGIMNYNPHFTYYMIDPHGKEMVQVDNANNYVNLFTHPSDGSMPFQVGVGANEVNGNLGAAGWLDWEHYYNGTLYKNPLDSHGDFAMDLDPVPEPSTLALALTGAAGFGLMAWRFGRKGRPFEMVPT